VIEQGNVVVSFSEAKRQRDIRALENFFKTPYGRGLMYQLELRVDREDDPDVPSRFDIERQDNILTFPKK
jgi:hypothetical protein